MALIRAAMEGGQPFAGRSKAARPAAPGVTVPDGLSAAAASGVADARAAARRLPRRRARCDPRQRPAGAGDGVLARTRAFLEAQVASRSLTPQADRAPDAVLSRMEDKLRHDDLAGALAESAQLPSEAAAAMAGWLDAARLRAATARDGLATLDATLPAHELRGTARCSGRS